MLWNSILLSLPISVLFFPVIFYYYLRLLCERHIRSTCALATHLPKRIHKIRHNETDTGRQVSVVAWASPQFHLPKTSARNMRFEHTWFTCVDALSSSAMQIKNHTGKALEMSERAQKRTKKIEKIMKIEWRIWSHVTNLLALDCTLQTHSMRIVYTSIV